MNTQPDPIATLINFHANRCPCGGPADHVDVDPGSGSRACRRPGGGVGERRVDRFGGLPPIECPRGDRCRWVLCPVHAHSDAADGRMGR